MMHVKLDELRGRKVFDANGREIGRVRAALVDMETWLVDTLSVGVSRHAAAELEMPWSFLRSFFRPPTVNVGTGQINAAGDAIALPGGAVPHELARASAVDAGVAGGVAAQRAVADRDVTRGIGLAALDRARAAGRLG